jgi:hypothetical protein
MNTPAMPPVVSPAVPPPVPRLAASQIVLRV